MQRQTTHTEEGQCAQISASQVIALQNAEIEQLAAIVLAQQQCQPIFSSSSSRKRTLHTLDTSPHYATQQTSHNLYSHLQASHHPCSEMSSENNIHGNSLVQISSHLRVSSPMESPEYLAHRLLVEFGKTRTNYNSLVPRIVEIIRMFRDYGPLRCPLPVVANLDELLNDEALTRIEQRYPNSIEAGFLVLCTERRALRSGGGGKYYFIDTSGRLVGCHKSDLPCYVEKGVLQGPVLLKNLIFVFILRGAFGLDPRCKSSNPQRLLEFYENLSHEGKASDIQGLVRVWSMEIYPEPPYDNGFPHCTLLWVKRMHISGLISKWRHSQWQTNQYRGHEFYTNSPLTTSLQNPSTLSYHSQCSNEQVSHNMAYHFTGLPVEDLHSSNLTITSHNKRHRVTEANTILPHHDTLYDCWESQETYVSNPLTSLYNTNPNPRIKNIPDTPLIKGDTTNYTINSTTNDVNSTMISCHVNFWEPETIQKLYGGFSNFASRLQKGEMMDWSVHVIERLSSPILEAAMYLISTTLRSENSREELTEASSGHTVKSLRYDILKLLWNEKERHRTAEGLRILLACLLQQQRLEELLPQTTISKEASDENHSSSTSQNNNEDNVCNVFNGVSIQSNCFDISSFATETTAAHAGTENETPTTTTTTTTTADCFEEGHHATSAIPSSFCIQPMIDTEHKLQDYNDSVNEGDCSKFFDPNNTVPSTRTNLCVDGILTSSESSLPLQNVDQKERPISPTNVDSYQNKDFQGMNEYNTDSQLVKYLRAGRVQDYASPSKNLLPTSNAPDHNTALMPDVVSMESHFFSETVDTYFSETDSGHSCEICDFSSSDQHKETQPHSLYMTYHVKKETHTMYIHLLYESLF